MGVYCQVTGEYPLQAGGVCERHERWDAIYPDRRPERRIVSAFRETRRKTGRESIPHGLPTLCANIGTLCAKNWTLCANIWTLCANIWTLCAKSRPCAPTTSWRTGWSIIKQSRLLSSLPDGRSLHVL